MLKNIYLTGLPAPGFEFLMELDKNICLKYFNLAFMSKLTANLFPPATSLSENTMD